MSYDELAARVRGLADIRFGGMSRFDPPVPEARVARFEQANHIALPDDYRWFVTTVASGGPGPSNGLIPFRSALVDERLAGSWIDPERYDEADDDGEGHPYEGVLAVGDLGCGMLAVLVLHGPHRGEVWNDLAASSAGYEHAASSFCAWYGAWVEAELAQAARADGARRAELDALCAAVASRPDDEDALRSALYGLGHARDARFADVLNRAIAAGALSPTAAPTITDDALALGLGADMLALVDLRIAEEGYGETVFRCLRALILAELGQLDAAHAEWGRARSADDFDPPPGCAPRIALAHLEAGDLASAVEVFVGTDDDVAGYASELVDEALRRSRPELAARWTAALVERLPPAVEEDDESLADAHYALGLALACLGRADEADDHLATAEALGARIDRARLALAACEARAFAAALRYLDWAAGRPEWIANLRGCCLEGLKRSEDALSSFEEALGHRNWIVPYENRAYSLIRLGRDDEAVALLDDVERFAPEFAWTHYHRATWLARRGDEAGARASLARAAELGFDLAVASTEPHVAALVDGVGPPWG